MLSRLILTDFRNHAEAVLHPGRGFVVLTGENGAGKTNVLEAVSLLAPGRGLRRAALSDMARQGGRGGFGVATTLKPLPFRGGVGGGGCLAEVDARVPHPNPSPEGEGL